MGLFKRKVRRSNRTNKEGFNGDIWTDALRSYGDKIPKNHIVYGELVGYTPNGAPIHKGHTYDELPGFYELYVYRVALITEDAELIDMTWDQVRYFCERHGLKHTPELDRMPKAVFDHTKFEELDFFKEHQLALTHGDRDPYVDAPVRLSAGGTGKDEGIAIRVDRGSGVELFKFKNKSHYLYESAELDSGEADLESQG